MSAFLLRKTIHTLKYIYLLLRYQFKVNKRWYNFHPIAEIPVCDNHLHLWQSTMKIELNSTKLHSNWFRIICRWFHFKDCYCLFVCSTLTSVEITIVNTHLLNINIVNFWHRGQWSFPFWEHCCQMGFKKINIVLWIFHVSQ